MRTEDQRSDVIELGAVTEETKGSLQGHPTDDGVLNIKVAGLSKD